ncbi:hypothetical protein F5148DRAFT_1285473 [Russula earlei]|uniref:Uncharacterized protein n=1 Tax=Russula earlei TaxID=71964 RepID=A0ACC0U7B6_9AGAM|nr:hypothetical protein F5148DRAFT_1285473 [Russula earlei]
MGQIPSRHRPDDPLASLPPVLSSAQSSSTRIADDSSPVPSQRPAHSPQHSPHLNSDLSHQPPLPPKRSRRRSFLSTLSSPLRSCTSPQRTPSAHSDLDLPSNNHKRWTFHRRRRKASELASTLPNYPEVDEPQVGEPSRHPMTSAFSMPPSDPATTGQNRQARDDSSSTSPSALPSTITVGPSSSGSSTVDDASQSIFVPFQSTATDLSSPSSSAHSSASSSSSPRGPLALNHDPAHLSNGL